MADEYISREAAIDCLHLVCVPQCRKYAQEEIKKIPAADVQPVRHGRWMYETETEMFQCSVCGGMAVRNEYPYCHWCGARMDLEADE